MVSYLHHFFANHGLGERVVHLHADNCVGQNKNNYVMQVTVTGIHIHNNPLMFVIVPAVACDGRLTRDHHAVLSASRTHKVLSRLVFRPSKEAVPAMCCQLSR